MVVWDFSHQQYGTSTKLPFDFGICAKDAWGFPPHHCCYQPQGWMRSMKKVMRWRYMYTYIPGTLMTSIFEGQPSKTLPFPIKTVVIWVPGMYIYIYMYVYIYKYIHCIFCICIMYTCIFFSVLCRDAFWQCTGVGGFCPRCFSRFSGRPEIWNDRRLHAMLVMLQK